MREGTILVCFQKAWSGKPTRETNNNKKTCQHRDLKVGVGGNKREFKRNEHALQAQKCFHQTPFQTCFHIPSDATSHSATKSDREERKSLFRLKWVSSEIMNMSLRKTKRRTKRATLLLRRRRWRIIVFKSGTTP